MRSRLMNDVRKMDMQDGDRKHKPVTSPYAKSSKAPFETADSTMQSGEDASDAAPATASPVTSERSLDEQVDATVSAICKQESMHAILYRLLSFCGERRSYPETETYISSRPEYRGIIQSPHTLIGFLVNSGGIEEIPLDDKGEVISDEAFCGKDAEQIDQMIASFSLLTTEAGHHALDILDPRKETRAAVLSKPARTHTYLAVLDYCRTPRKLADIQHLFQEDDSLVLDECMDRQKLSPDYYVNVLEKSGGLLWKGAWETTEAGLALLAESRKG